MEYAQSVATPPASPEVFSRGAAAAAPETAHPATPAATQEAAAALGYAGEIAPGQAWQLFQSGQAALVDVRTADELHWVGRVPGALHVEWATGREQVRNPLFLEQLSALVPKDRQVLFLCRSGARSSAAAKAATEAGYRSAWNILQGFEGPIDTQKQRGRIGGWRSAGLPWQQS